MKNIIADSHADTIQFSLDNNMSLIDRDLSFNTIDVRDYLPYIQCLSCFVHDDYAGRGYDRVNKMLNHYFNEEEKNKDTIIRIKNKDDVDSVLYQNKLGVLLTVENGLALDGNINNLYELYQKGIRMMTLTWNNDNQLGCGALTSSDKGLTSFGKKCINIMNKLNMIIDVSHASVKTFWDALSITTKPVIASHSNVYRLCKNKRNLTDIQIKEIARVNGLIGVTYCNKFLTSKNTATIQDIVNHISYICDIVGTEYVCIGSDFDGVDKDNLPENLKGVKDIYKLEERMLYNGFNKEDVRKIMGYNLVRFLRNNLD